MWLPIRGTSDMTEATHSSQCVHDQQRRLEAEDCDSIRCAQLISGGRRRIRPPCTVPRSRSPTMRCIRLVSRCFAIRGTTVIRAPRLAARRSVSRQEVAQAHATSLSQSRVSSCRQLLYLSKTLVVCSMKSSTRLRYKSATRLRSANPEIRDG